MSAFAASCFVVTDSKKAKAKHENAFKGKRERKKFINIDIIFDVTYMINLVLSPSMLINFRQEADRKLL